MTLADDSIADFPDEEAAFAELHLEQQLCLALQISSNLVTGIYRGQLKPLGLTYSQYLVLIALWEHGRRTMGELRNFLCMDTGTVTPLVKRMEQAGLLKRSRDTQDERRVWVDLTDAGWALRGRVAEARREVVRRLPMTGVELAQLRGVLQTLNAQLLAAEDDAEDQAA